MSKVPKGQVRLDPRVQEKLLQQMREERDAKRRGRMLRRYVLLPLIVGALGWSALAMIGGQGVETHVGGLVLSSILWYFWIVRKRLPALFGFD